MSHKYGWDPAKRPRTLHIWVGTRGTCECGAYTGPDPRLYWSKTANLPGGAKVCQRCLRKLETKMNPPSRPQYDSLDAPITVYHGGPLDPQAEWVWAAGTKADARRFGTPVYKRVLPAGSVVVHVSRLTANVDTSRYPDADALHTVVGQIDVWYVRERRTNPGRSYLDRAIKEFGTTDDPGTGFFILPDGSFLDGSAGSGYMRADDHRILAGLYPNSHKAEQKHGSRYALLVKIMQRANLIRWVPEAWSADVVTQPTSYQIRTLEDLAQMQTMTVEVFRQTREFDSYNAERIEGWIDRVL